MMKKSNKKGFTLVELIVVIAIMAILAAVLVPTVTNKIKDANAASQATTAENIAKTISLHLAETADPTKTSLTTALTAAGYTVETTPSTGAFITIKTNNTTYDLVYSNTKTTVKWTDAKDKDTPKTLDVQGVIDTTK